METQWLQRFRTEVILASCTLQFAAIYNFHLTAQNLIFRDSILVSLQQQPLPPASLVSYRIIQQAEYGLALSNLLYLNWQKDPGVNQISFVQRLLYRTDFSNERNFKAAGTFNHDLGIQLFFDSICRFQPDVSAFELKTEVKAGKYLVISMITKLSTRLFNNYNYSIGPNGDLQRILQSGFFTPLVLTFSAGFGLRYHGLIFFHLGLTGGKLTYIKNRDVYNEQKIKSYHGVSIDRSYLFEYGIAFQMVIDKDLSGSINWNVECNLFKNLKKPVDLAIKNLIGWKIGKHFKGIVKTNIFYEQETSRKVQFENLFSLGFLLNI